MSEVVAEFVVVLLLVDLGVIVQKPGQQPAGLSHLTAVLVDERWVPLQALLRDG